VAQPDTSAAASPDTSRVQPDTTRAAKVDTTRAMPDTLRKIAPADSARMALVSSLVGTWGGTAEHEGESQPLALGFAPGEGGRMGIYLSMPVAHLDRVPLGQGKPVADGDSVRLGSLHFLLDRAKGEISGHLPSGLVPYYPIPFHLHRVDRFDVPARDSLRVPEPRTGWTFDAGSPIWAGPTIEGETIYVGAENGDLIALDAKSGERRWVFHAWGAIRAHPTLYKGTVYVQADDGDLYAVDASKGHLQWKLRINDGPIKRLPPDDPKSLYDRFSSDVVVDGDRLFVGTHEGKVLALKAKDGKQIWEFEALGPVLAAPAVEKGKVIFGSYDHFVYALDEKEGQLLWKRDTHGAVVSTPALFGDHGVVGNRIYDLLGFDTRTGRVSWKKYIWMSWVESSPTATPEGIAYVGSSDATAVFAYEAESGKRLWATDVQGWSWGQPAVDDRRVYAGVSSQVGYGTGHSGSAVALDRETGEAVWRFRAPAPASGDYGFAGSPAIGPDFVYFASLDGKVYALEP
jgi:eukaryotic-like serine/threonine-protein kinase